MLGDENVNAFSSKKMCCPEARFKTADWDPEMRGVFYIRALSLPGKGEQKELKQRMIADIQI